MEFTRREFLKTAGAVTGGLALSGCGIGESEQRVVPFHEIPEQQVAGTFTYFASTCRECPAGCGILGRTMGGRANKLEGNPQQPVSQGRLCARGQAGLQGLYNPDRLEGPRVRTGNRGESDFEDISWDDAITRLADAIGQAGGRIGVVAGFVPDHLYRLVTLLLDASGADAPIVWNLFRAHNARNLLESAAEEVFGVRRLPLFDIGRADYVVSFNANFLETWLSPVQYARGYSELRTGASRGTLVQVEPRFSSTAGSADVFLAPPGGREGDLALLMGKIILDEGLADPGRPAGLDALFQDVSTRALAEELGLDFELVVLVARSLAGARAPLCIPGGGLAAFRSAPEAVRAVMALNLLVGAPNTTLWLTPPPPASALLPLEKVSPFADVRQLVSRMAGGELDVLLVLDGDPLHDFPEALGFADAAGSVPLIADFSPFPTDTNVFLADLQLPGDTYLESWGWEVPTPGTALPTLSAQQPVVRSLYNTAAPANVLLAAAARVGGAVAAALPWENELAYVQDVVTGLDLGGRGSILATDPEEFFRAWRQFGGWWGTDEALPPVVPSVPQNVRAAAPEEPGDNARPFRLHVYPHLLLAEGRHANKPWCQEVYDPMTTVTWHSWVEVNPEIAEELEVETGDIVRVTSDVSDVQVPVYVYPGIGRDIVAMPLGQGHEAYGRYAADRGVNTADLVELVEVPGTGELAFGETRVTLEKTGESLDLARVEQSDSRRLPTGVGISRAIEE